MAEYPIYVKALIKRQRGEINESLQLFQAATCLNPHNVANLKQVGRSLYLLARHKAALDVYEEALRIGVDDWEIWHNKGLCNMYLKQYGQSIECFKRANSIQRHDTTFMQLGKVRLIPYIVPGSSEIGRTIEGLAGKHAAVMLASHGPVISAKTLEAAVYAAEELEATAKLAYLTRSLEPNMLSNEQVQEIVKQYNVEWD